MLLTPWVPYANSRWYNRTLGKWSESNMRSDRLIWISTLSYMKGLKSDTDYDTYIYCLVWSQGESPETVRHLEAQARSLVDCACWGRPLGSSQLWKENLEIIQRVSSLANSFIIAQVWTKYYFYLCTQDKFTKLWFYLFLWDHYWELYIYCQLILSSVDTSMLIMAYSIIVVYCDNLIEFIHSQGILWELFILILYIRHCGYCLDVAKFGFFFFVDVPKFYVNECYRLWYA